MQPKTTYRLHIAFLSLSLLFTAGAWGQGGTWTWMRGSQLPNPVPVYGIEGVADPRDDPQGFYEAANWIDLQGNFWIFGGVDSACSTGCSEAGDLWKYNPVNNVWTWVNGPEIPDQPGIYGTQGVPAPGNIPGARGWGCLSWTDNNGNLWLFGGSGHDVTGETGDLSDLWKYDIANGEWTWVSGSMYANQLDVYGNYQQASDIAMPGGRQENCSAWVDNDNNLWLFGGLGLTGFYNDMWRYNISTNQWAWMKGAQYAATTYSYGTIGVEDSNNLPPGRGTYTRWRDEDGNLYIWGGIKSFDPEQLYSDVWKYNISTNNWTWVAGDSTINSDGDYNEYCEDNGKTGPMARGENRTAQTFACADVFLTFGGFTSNVNPDLAPSLNDLWLFNTKTDEWRWISGSDTANSAGNYGTQGIASVSNTPPGLFGGCMWVDKNGTFWFFGGQDINSYVYNAMWKFIPDTSCIQAALTAAIQTQLSPAAICPGDTSLLTISGVTGANISPLTGITWVDSLHAYLYPDTTTSYVVSDSSPCSASNFASVSLDVVQPVHMNYSLPDSQICIGNSVLLTVINGSDIQISPLTGVNWQDSTHALLAPDSTTTYTITGQSTCVGNNTLIATLHISAPTVQIASDTNRVCEGDSVQICATNGFSSYEWNNGASGSCIYVRQQGSYYVMVKNQINCPATSDSIGISVLQTPPISILLSKADICVGDSAVLNLSGTPSPIISPLTDVSWIDSTHAYLYPPATTSYVITNNLPCSADSSITLKVTEPLYMNYSLSDSQVCIGDSALLMIINGGNVQVSPSTGFRWVDSTEAVLSPEVTTTYVITGQSTCVSNNVLSATLNVDAPTVSIEPDNSNLCSGDTAQLCAGREFASYRWNNGDTTLCVNITNEGIYFVQVRDFNNCPATSNSATVSVLPAPDISIIVVGDSFNVFQGTVVQWYRNGIAIPGATGQMYIATEPGDYTVAVVDTDGCHATSSAIEVTATGVINLTENQISLYPNPSNGIWNLSVSNYWLGGQLDIYDAEGRLVYTSEIHNLKSEIQLNVEAGIYMLRLSAGGQSWVRKLVRM